MKKNKLVFGLVLMIPILIGCSNRIASTTMDNDSFSSNLTSETNTSKAQNDSIIDSQNAVISSLEQENQLLKEALLETTSHLEEETEKNNHTINELNQKITTLTSAYNELKTELDNQKNINQMQKEDLEQLQAELSELNETLSSLQEALNEYQIINNNLEDKVNNLEQQLQDKEAEIDSLKSELTETQSELEEFKKTLEETQNTLSSVNDKLFSTNELLKYHRGLSYFSMIDFDADYKVSIQRTTTRVLLSDSDETGSYFVLNQYGITIFEEDFCYNDKAQIFIYSDYLIFDSNINNGQIIDNKENVYYQINQEKLLADNCVADDIYIETILKHSNGRFSYSLSRLNYNDAYSLSFIESGFFPIVEGIKNVNDLATIRGIMKKYIEKDKLYISQYKSAGSFKPLRELYQEEIVNSDNLESMADILKGESDKTFVNKRIYNLNDSIMRTILSDYYKYWHRLDSKYEASEAKELSFIQDLRYFVYLGYYNGYYCLTIGPNGGFAAFSETIGDVTFRTPDLDPELIGWTIIND